MVSISTYERVSSESQRLLSLAAQRNGSTQRAAQVETTLHWEDLGK